MTELKNIQGGFLSRKHLLIFGVLLIALVLLFLLDLFLGSVRIPFSEIVRILISGEGKEEWVTIIYKFRFPKAITALLAGVALSVSGLQMQTVFRNPLAGPYVLGISAGASLGVAILMLGFSSLISASNILNIGNWAIVTAAWIGSGVILFLILMVSMRVRDIMTILILGIMFGSATTAVVSILQYFSHETALKAFVVWTMGSLGHVSHEQLQVLSFSVIVGLGISFASVKLLNALLLGETYATSLGLNVKASRILIFVSTSILAGSITAFCGPIGFIGIAVPHIARMIFNTADHRILLSGTLVLGGILLLFSDIIAHVPGYGTILPINSVTALVGIPVVVWIIIRNRKYSAFS